MSKILNNNTYVAISSDYDFISWKELEKILDRMCDSVQDLPDIVIGIKTGGAILAGYVARKINRPLDFIRTKRAIYNCSSNVSSSIDMFKDATNTELKVSEKYQVCEKPSMDIRGKRVLLIDETTYSGGTVKYAKEYLLQNGASRVDVFIVSVIKDAQKYEYVGARGVAGWPWSFDN